MVAHGQEVASEEVPEYGGEDPLTRAHLSAQHDGGVSLLRGELDRHRHP